MYRSYPLALGQPDALVDLSRSKGIEVPATVSTVVDALHWRASRAPENTAFFVIETPQSVVEISNGALLAQAQILAARLTRQGLKRGDVVLLALETSADLLTALFACFVGAFTPCVVEAPPVNSNKAQWAERLAVRARHVDCKLIISREDCREALSATGCISRTLDELPEAAPSKPELISGTDAVFLQFTSGTTSQPKALLVNHETLLSNVRGLAQAGSWDVRDTVVSWLPLYHDMGLVALMLTGFTAGIPVVLMPSNLFTMNPVRWMWAIHTFKGTVTSAPNFAYQFVASHAPEHRTRGLDLSHWRQGINAAEFVQKKTIDQFTERFAPHGFKREVFAPAYGLAECTVAASIKRPTDPLRFDVISRSTLANKGVALPANANDPDAFAVVCTGPALDGHHIRIIDEHGALLPDRTQGQISIYGPSVVPGYYGELKPSKVHDGWLETGDLGYLDAGQLFVTGRIKDLIIRAGANISPYEIEHVAAEIDGVRSGAVGAIGLVDDRKGTENLVVFFETTSKTLSTVEATRKAIRERLTQKLSISVDHVFELPPHSLQKTTSGKLQRVKLVELARERLRTHDSHVM
ncbi:AMP-binding protein [Microvirga flavescens]|uniref:AMP-binding protein n=1 Tax=Microvirga flavescens TaxID=2249811 RepID=UPI001300698B|nr:AMP-binding protein [Microvirga flavescens]